MFNAFDFDGFEPNNDNSEDFKHSIKENSKRFGSPLPENAIVRAICERVASCKNTKRQRSGQSVFLSRGAMLMRSRIQDVDR